MKNENKIANGTFILKLKRAEDHKWSGNIKLVDTGTDKQFDGALELIRIIDDAIEGRE